MTKQTRRIYRLKTVEEITGYKRSSIYNKMACGEFPQCVKLGPRAVGWDSNEVEAWVNSKLGGQA